MTAPPLALALMAIFAGGIAISVQAPINARLGGALGDPIWAAAVSFAVGTLVLFAAALALGTAPSGTQIASVPWWAWTGGALGTIYVLGALWAVPSLGVVTLVAVLILGQMSAALLLDAVGAFGLQVREIGLPRLAGIALVAAGVVLSRL